MKIVKDTWDKISVGDYLEMRRISQEDDVIDVEIDLLALLCCCSSEDILSLPVPEYQGLRSKIQFISSIPEIKHNNIPKVIILNGTKYNICTDMSKLIAAQYIDYQTYFKLYSRNKTENDKYIPNMLACFMVKDGCKYGDDIEGVIGDITSYLPILTAFEMVSFFQRAFLSSIRGMLHYLEYKVKKMKVTKMERQKIREMMKQTHSLINGVGLTM